MISFRRAFVFALVTICCTISIFASSGIYLRGGLNSWAASSDWEFVDEGNGVYTLTDKVVYGEFKIADSGWSSTCNYGAGTGNILLDQVYELSSGDNPGNISCGSNSYACTKITFTIPTEGNATLLLEGNNDSSDLTEVYVIGDNNGWDFMDASGILMATANDGEFKGTVTMVGASSTATYCYWRIYQRLGMGGGWGAPGGLDTTEDVTSGTMEQGSTGCYTTLPGTYTVTFNVNTGAFSLERLPSVATTMMVWPTDAVIVPTVPENVKILSLNNSLIDYNDQNLVFNELATAMGKSAAWTKHTLLGKSLNTHYNEGEGLTEAGTPSAKMMVRSEAWTHIILQEQSGLPSNDPAAFRNSVKLWKDYIRENCPNPNAVIIVPMNWAYSSDWDNFKTNNKALYDSYMAVAQEMGVVLCPIQKAYESILDEEGAGQCGALFSDDRHPTFMATYLAACMEYSLIYNEDAKSITYVPANVNADDAQKMRDYASSALSKFENIVDNFARKVRFTSRIVDQYNQPMQLETPTTWSNEGGNLDSYQIFTAGEELGEYKVTAANDTFTATSIVKVAEAEDLAKDEPAVEFNGVVSVIAENFDGMGVEATATLPTGWRIDKQTGSPRTLGLFSLAAEQTEQSGGNSLASNAKNGIYNFGAGDPTVATDRAIGGISTSVSGGTRCVNVYMHIRNTGTQDIENLNIAYDIEKYRKGSNAAGFATQLYYSVDGSSWITAGEDFYTLFEADNATEGYASVPGDSRTVNKSLGMGIKNGEDIYLAWNISVASGTAANAAQALGIDNVKINAETSGMENVLSTNTESITLVAQQGMIRVKADSSVKEIKAYTLSGVSIMSVLDSDELDMSGMAQGIYVIKVSTENGIKNFKVVR